MKRLRTDTAVLRFEHLQLANKFVQASVAHGGPSQSLQDEFLRKNKELSERRYKTKADYETARNVCRNLRMETTPMTKTTTAHGVIAKIRSALRPFARI
ncbi:unnamed protein product [Gongylonema pulchrum]|uniref:Uncharacterized protein n=1 Tax=Gongylonema pulchrum TaxID=637853 RepID=A0A183DCV6_9BILA|nr:unnamed protein product [Gongylonema pulchrum]